MKHAIKELLMTTHPDDAEGLFGEKIQAEADGAHVVVITNGDLGIDHQSNRARDCLCPAR